MPFEDVTADQLAERDIVRDGSSVWIWDSKEKTAQHVLLPSKKSAIPTPTTPSDLAKRLLTAVQKSSTVTVTTGSSVAGRTVDRLEGSGPRRPGADIAAEAPQRAAPLPAGHAHPEPMT